MNLHPSAPQRLCAPTTRGGHTEVRRVDTCQLVPWCGKNERGGGRTRNEVVFVIRTAAVSSARYQFFMIDLVREQQQSTLDDRSADVRGTNKSKNKGLISADRRTKPTLMLTIPRSLVKSSTKDLSFPTVGIVFQRTLVGHLGGLECVAIL